MFIRRTTIKSRESGEPYYTDRLVESVRSGAGVRQHTVLNLGRDFEVPRPQWGPLAQRIEALLGGQLDLIADGLDAQWEALARRYAARIVSRRGTVVVEQDGAAPEGDYQRVDLSRLEVIRPRSVGAEHVALEALRRLGLDRKLVELGFNRHQLSAAIGTIIGRMVQPGSELATHQWLQQRSGLGELLDYDFGALDVMRLYRVSDQLLAQRVALEAHLDRQERDLFSLSETITLYDLTNTFFEGTASGNPKAEGNVSEPKTLEKMLERLALAPGAVAPTVVLDAGIATEANLAWLTEQGYRYLVVSRERHKQFETQAAVLIREEGDTQIRAQRVVDEVTGEVRLVCHSTGREAKERGIEQRFSTRLEADLQYLAEGLHLPRRVKNYDKLLTRIGRLRQRYSRVARYYDIRLDKDEASGNATALVWTRIVPTEDTLPGVYCLRTNQADWDERTLWNTYTMLTDLKAVFRSLKSELGLRPIYHHKSARVDGHLFISVLAYHLVHTLRIRLKAQGIHLSWESLRNQFAGQERVTVVLHRDDGQIYHIRKATRPEPHQQVLYNALGLPHLPGKTEKTLIDPRAEVSQM